MWNNQNTSRQSLQLEYSTDLLLESCIGTLLESTVLDKSLTVLLFNLTCPPSGMLSASGPNHAAVPSSLAPARTYESPLTQKTPEDPLNPKKPCKP